MFSDIEIAQRASLRPIAAPGEELKPCGRHKAKVSLTALERLGQRPGGPMTRSTLVLTSAVAAAHAAGVEV